MMRRDAWSGRVRMEIVMREDDCTDEERAAALCDVRHLAFADQVHGSDVAVVRGESHGKIRCDALLTDASDLTLCVRWADCQHFVLFAPEKRVLGVAHAGWRGMAARVLTSWYRALRTEWGIEPSDTHVYAGPSLCVACAAFTDPTLELPSHLHPFIRGTQVDLRAAADAELALLGVPEQNRERVPDCTRCKADTYWSARAARTRGEKTCGRNFLLATMC